MSDYDIQMKVKLCSKHRKFFDSKVRCTLKKKDYIKPENLANLLEEINLCLDCEWETKFGKERIR